MPIYEYKCTRCQHEQEVFHRGHGEHAPACASCGELSLERQMSRSHFKLNGGGWYANDYASSGGNCSTGNCCSTGSCCGAGGCGD